MDGFTKGALLGSLVVRLSASRGVVYANDAFCKYLGVGIQEIIGRSARDLASLTTGEVADFFENPISAAIPNRLLADSSGRIFELKTSARQGLSDIVFDEVFDLDELERVIGPALGTPINQLGEDELRTIRIPDLRRITCCSAHIKSSIDLVGKIPALEHRIITGTFLEEATRAFLKNACTVLPVRGATCTGFAGAPRHHADHSLRALKSAFELVWRSERIRSVSVAEGRDMPPVGCGVASGDALTGGFAGGTSLVYLAEGECVTTAERLAQIAGPAEILLTQASLDHIFSSLPEGWHALEFAATQEVDLSAYAAFAGSVVPLEEMPRVFTIGPAGDDGSRAVYRFDEVWRLEQTGAEPSPVFRATQISEDFVLPGSEETISEDGCLARLGKYRLLEVLGSGGMGRVWKGQDAYGNTVAIKTLHSFAAQSQEATRRFRREAEVMSKVPHRNVCRIFETGEHDGTPFLVMEYVEGLTLAELLHADSASTAGRSGNSADLSSLIAAVRQSRISRPSRDGTEEEPREEEPDSGPDLAGNILPVEQILDLIKKVCEAVEFAHQHGILHRDLKPGNILLRADGEPLVADFGLAKLSGETTGDAPSISISGQVVGTVENMAPEQAASSKSVDARADVYSLGTILYQMCTGRRHFKGTGNFVADLQAIQNHEPRKPRALNPSIDPDLEVIILKCLRAEPDERYRSVSALLADLQRFERGESIAARPLSSLQLARKIVRRNKTASLVALVALALILILVAGSFWSLTDRLAKEKKARTEAERMRQLAESAATAQLAASQKANELASAKNTSSPGASDAVDLGLGTGASQWITPTKGGFYQIIGFEGSYALLHVGSIDAQGLSYDWKTPEGLAGSGRVDFSADPRTIDLQKIKLGWNNYFKTFEFYSDKGMVQVVGPADLQKMPWAAGLGSNPALASANPQSDTRISYIRTPLSNLPLSELLEKANSNDVVAQIEVGHRYKSGKDVEKNNDLAAVWYQKASRQGSREADMCIARLNWLGRMEIEPSSWENAFKVFESLATDGSGPSQHYAGLCNLHGRGTNVNHGRAAYWFTQSIANAQKNTYKKDSLWELGNLHLAGSGVPKDLEKARSYISQSADLEHEDAKDWLARNGGGLQ